MNRSGVLRDVSGAMNEPPPLDARSEPAAGAGEYLRCFRDNGVRRFDWGLVDPALVVGSRVVVWQLAGPLLKQWTRGAAALSALPDRAGQRATVVGQLTPSQVRFMQRLYDMDFAEEIPVVRVLFDDAMVDLGGQASFAESEAVPAALCLTLANAQIPRSHERVTRFGLDELVGHTAASEWMRFRLARHG
jgi:hypothetical protein